MVRRQPKKLQERCPRFDVLLATEPNSRSEQPDFGNVGAPACFHTLASFENHFFLSLSQRGHTPLILRLPHVRPQGDSLLRRIQRFAMPAQLIEDMTQGEMSWAGIAKRWMRRRRLSP